MSEEHKAALAKGRAQTRAVKGYLEALETTARRGPKITPEKLNDRISETKQAIEAESDPVRRLELIQRRMDDEDRLAELEESPDIEALEQEFTAVAKEYSERRGITWSAWRELGVPAATLRNAGVPRTRRTN